jgi:intracellular multiplication protein IcmD
MFKRELPTSLGRFSLLVGLLVCSQVALASGGLNIASVASTMQTQINSLVSFLIIVSYVCGIGACLISIMQFKAHKDNPQQVPLSKPMVYLVVGAALLFLPSILQIAGNSIFGTTAGSGVGGKAGV